MPEEQDKQALLCSKVFQSLAFPGTMYVLPNILLRANRHLSLGFLVCLVEWRDWLDILGVDIHAAYLLFELRIDAAGEPPKELSLLLEFYRKFTA